MTEQWQEHWILAETPELLILNKPSGLALLADRSEQNNLWSLAKQRYPDSKLVHRIDKGTSGVLVLARKAATQALLTRAFAKREVRKRYLAVVAGCFPSGSYSIDLPLRPGRKNRYRIAGPRDSIRLEGRRYSCERDEGKAFQALTRVRRLAVYEQSSLLLLQPTTGRRHQLRVQLAWLGHPILGDHLYGRQQAKGHESDRLLLHASAITLPGFGHFCAPLPADWDGINRQRR